MIEFKKGIIHKDAAQISSFMKQNNYQYFLLGSVEISDNPDGTMARLLNETIISKDIELANSSLFSTAHIYDNGVVAIFKVK